MNRNESDWKRDGIDRQFDGGAYHSRNDGIETNVERMANDLIIGNAGVRV